ncbi:MAG TPA: biopolymer transporter ExbD [Pyrinomonadaceae bacterium]
MKTALNRRFVNFEVCKRAPHALGGVLLLLTFLRVTPSRPAPAPTPTPTPQPSERHIKPNPQTLLVEIRRDLKISLNQLDMGAVNSPEPLGKTLEEAFKQRKELGIYNPETYEIDKTVLIKADRAIKYGDLLKVAKRVLDSGASPVGLVTDEKKVPLDANTRPEVMRRDIPADEQETTPPVSQSFPKTGPEVATLRVIVASTSQGTTAVVKRVMQDERIDPETIRKSAAVVEVKGDGEYYLDGRRVEKAALYQGLKDWFKGEKEEDKDTYIIARADLDYGTVEDAINETWEANPRVILVTGSTVSQQPATNQQAAASSTNWTPVILEILGGILILSVVWFVLARRRS